MNPHTTSACRIALASIGLALAPALYAETLVQYDFTSSRSAVTASDSGVSATSLSAGTGIQTISGQKIQLSSSSGAAKHIYLLGTQVDEPISAASGDWIGFSTTATTGNVLNLSSISFDYAYTYTTGPSNPAPTTPAVFEVRSSLDNYGSSVGSVSLNPVSGTTPNWNTASISLTAAAYQQLDSITFQIFFNDGANASSTSYLRVDNLTLSGVSAVPVPEPSSYALLAGLGGLFVTGLRRRRNRAV